MKQYRRLLRRLSSYPLSKLVEGIANARVRLIFEPGYDRFPQGFPQGCGKAAPLKVLLQVFLFQSFTSCRASVKRGGD